MKMHSSLTNRGLKFVETELNLFKATIFHHTLKLMIVIIFAMNRISRLSDLYRKTFLRPAINVILRCDEVPSTKKYKSKEIIEITNKSNYGTWFKFNAFLYLQLYKLWVFPKTKNKCVMLLYICAKSSITEFYFPRRMFEIGQNNRIKEEQN